ncbi:MAG: T9SS type A sorting domain-containing protein [Candidatus Delongbacteria bacterium]|nr:T9SS type A sorting domain-containing protein [bacterium]MBL7032819.1 T9SS type A sorting domain-containing protein [Candidatus Delongbacteria bacterium]
MRHFIGLILLFAATTATFAVTKPSVDPAAELSTPVLQQELLTERNGDTCDDAIQITYWPYSVNGTTSDNTNTYGNPSPDEWYRISLPSSGNVYVGLCSSNWDTYLRLLSDDCNSELFSNDDSCGLQSEMQLALSPGSYKICVEGYSSNSGSYTLEVTSDVPMHGDTCDDPLFIESFPFTEEAMTLGYNDDGFNPAPDAFYQFLVEDDGLYTFTTCQSELHDDYFDTYLLILAEDCSAVVAENDDDCDGAFAGWSTINCCLPQGLYYLVVEGHASDSGNFIIDGIREADCTPCYPPECPAWGIDEVEPNGGPDSDPPAYDAISAGETHCGTVWSAADVMDGDWYQFTLNEETPLEFRLDGAAEQNLELTLIDESSGSPVILATGELQNECADYLLEFTVDVGSYSICVAYADFDAEGPVSNYTLTWIDLQSTDSQTTPPAFQLAQNYPNPFNPSTTIEFSLAIAASVKLAVYDLAGKQVALLAQGMKAAGQHSVVFDAADLPSGLYFYRLNAANHTVSRKMILVR